MHVELLELRKHYVEVELRNGHKKMAGIFLIVVYFES